MSTDPKTQHTPFQWESEEHRLRVLHETIAAGAADVPSNAPMPSRAIPASPASPPRPVADSDIYTEEDLTAFTHRTRWVSMPGGKKACVHTLSLEEVGWVNAQALEYLRQKKVARDAPDYDIQRALAVKLFQTIVCTRRGADPEAETVFTPAKHENVARRLGWTKIEQIGNLSDLLGLEDGELDVVTDFFGLVARFSEILSSRLRSKSPSPDSTLREALAAFGSCASRVKQRSGLMPSDVDELNIILATLEAQPDGRSN